MNVSRGDVVLVDYPFSDRTGSKVRGNARSVTLRNGRCDIDDTRWAFAGPPSAAYDNRPSQFR